MHYRRRSPHALHYEDLMLVSSSCAVPNSLLNTATSLLTITLSLHNTCRRRRVTHRLKLFLSAYDCYYHPDTSTLISLARTAAPPPTPSPPLAHLAGMPQGAVCEHVLEERRASISSATSRDSLSIAVLPSVPIPGRARRRSSVRRANTSTPSVSYPLDTGVCRVCGCVCACAETSQSASSPSSGGQRPTHARRTSYTTAQSFSTTSSPPTAQSPPQSPIIPPHYHHEPTSLAPRTSPVPEGAERDSDETSTTKASEIHSGIGKLARERRRDRIFRYLPKSEGEYDVESQEIQRTWAIWANESVKTNALVPALVTQALATGLLDATTYVDFETFASNQTGNAILLTVAAVGTATILLILTAVSFGSFLAGAFMFGQIGHVVGVRRRAWLMISTAVQTLFLVIACVLLSPHGPAATRVGGKHEWVVLMLFASMSGGQVAMARQSSCQELPTAPMTSTFVDFVADHYLFAAWGDPKATSRNRRLAYVIAMIGGSFLGAVMHRYASSWLVAVIAVGVKLCALGLIALAQPDGCYD